jgi:hypothetical protein
MDLKEYQLYHGKVFPNSLDSFWYFFEVNVSEF